MSARPHGPSRTDAPLLLIPLVLSALASGVASGAAVPGSAGAQEIAQPVPARLTLVDAAERALRLDPWLAAADAGVEGARERVDGARASLFPSLSGSATGVRFGEPMVVAPLHGFDPSAPPDFDRTLLQGSLDLSWTVWDGGARSARIDGAEAAWTGALARGDAARQERLADLVDRFLAVLTARDVVDARSRREEALLAERERVQRFLTEGTAPRVDLLRVDAELSDARAEAEAARADRVAAEAALARSLGIDPARVSAIVLADPVLEDAEPSSDGQALHPLVAAATARAAAARAVASGARAARLPTVAATGALQEYGGADSDFATEWQTGLRISYPLFTGGARSAAIDEAAALSRQAEAEVEQAHRAVAEAEDRARARLQAARAGASALENAVERFQELARVEALALSEGAGVQSDLLRAQAGLAEARAGLASARRDVVRARVALARARGVLSLDWLDTSLTISSPSPGNGEARP